MSDVQIIETSMNFDMGMFRRLLGKISEQCPMFGAQKADNAISTIKAMKRNETRNHHSEIEFDGQRFYLGFEIFLGEVDAVDARFWGSPAFIGWLRSEYFKMCDELGV